MGALVFTLSDRHHTMSHRDRVTGVTGVTGVCAQLCGGVLPQLRGITNDRRKSRSHEGMAMTSWRRLRWTAGATVLTVAMTAAAVALPGTANAQPCNLDAPQGSCITQGSASLGPGTLTLVAPPFLNWFGQITGTTQTLYDTFPTDMGLEVPRPTGPAPGRRFGLERHRDRHAVHRRRRRNDPGYRQWLGARLRRRRLHGDRQ